MAEFPGNSEYQRELTIILANLDPGVVQHDQAVQSSPRRVRQYTKAIELKPDNAFGWHSQALLSLSMDDSDGYRKRCASMLKHFGQIEKADTAFWVAWTCVLADDAVEDLSQVVQLAEQLVLNEEKKDLYLSTLGKILYRAGSFDEAVQQLSKLTEAWEQRGEMPTLISPTYTWFFLAMAHHQLGHLEEAKKWLDKAVKRAEQEIADDAAWNRKLTLQLFRTEAESLLGLSEASVSIRKEVVHGENE